MGKGKVSHDYRRRSGALLQPVVTHPDIDAFFRVQPADDVRRCGPWAIIPTTCPLL